MEYRSDGVKNNKLELCKRLLGLKHGKASAPSRFIEKIMNTKLFTTQLNYIQRTARYLQTTETH